MNKNHQKYLTGANQASKDSFMAKLNTISSDKNFNQRQSNLMQFNQQNKQMVAAPNKNPIFGFGSLQTAVLNSKAGVSSNNHYETGDFGLTTEVMAYNINQNEFKYN